MGPDTVLGERNSEIRKDLEYYHHSIHFRGREDPKKEKTQYMMTNIIAELWKKF